MGAGSTSSVEFRLLYTLSTDRFINVSVQTVRNATLPGLPDRTGEGLLLWGSGRYRASDIYLAYLPLDRIEDRSQLSYFRGSPDSDGALIPRWSGCEPEAVPLFPAGCVGELSCAGTPS